MTAALVLDTARRYSIDDERTVFVVLRAIADRDKPYGLHAEDADTTRLFREITRELPGFGERFRAPGACLLGAEQTAVLFESLVDYQAVETTCDIPAGIHDGKRDYTGFCDCDKRNRAFGWAVRIAAHNDVDVF